LILANGDWDIILRGRLTPYHYLQNVQWNVHVKETKANNDLQEESSSDPATFTTTVRSTLGPDLFGNSHVTNSYTNVVFTEGPIKIRSATGYGEIRVQITNLEASFKSGLIIDYVEAERANDALPSSRRVQHQPAEVPPRRNPISAAMNAVSHAFSRVIGHERSPNS
jgi:hypothetical protein